MCSKRFGTGLKRILVLFLLSLVVLSHSAFSEVILTDEQWERIEKDYEIFKKTQTEEQKSLNERNQELNKKENNLNQKEIDLQKKEQTLNEKEKDLILTQEIIRQDKEQLMTLDKSLKKSERQRKLEKVKNVAILTVSIIGSFYAGYKIRDFIK